MLRFPPSNLFVMNELSLHVLHLIFIFIDFILLSFGCQVTLPMKSFNALALKEIDNEKEKDRELWPQAASPTSQQTERAA